MGISIFDIVTGEIVTGFWKTRVVIRPVRGSRVKY